MKPTGRTRHEIERLQQAAAEAGDYETVATCEAALAGDPGSRIVCASILDAGEAMDDDECGWCEP